MISLGKNTGSKKAGGGIPSLEPPKYVTKGAYQKRRMKGVMIIYGKPVRGKTKVARDMLRAGYNITFIDHDFNSSWFDDMTEEEHERFNYIYVKDSPNTLNTPKFYNNLQTDGLASVCRDHGFVDCGACTRSGGEIISFDPSKLTNTVVFVDSMTSNIDSITLQVKKDVVPEAKAGATATSKEDAKMTYNHFGQQGVRLANVMHFLKSLQVPVILIAHRVNMVNSIANPDSQPKWHPYLGTKPASETQAGKFNFILYAKKDADVFVTKETPTIFATVRGADERVKGLNRLETIKALIPMPVKPSA